MKSYWRVHCHKQFGGQLWLGVLIALGDVPPLAVQLTNQIIAERIRAAAGREAQNTAVPGPRLSAQNAARVKGEPVPPVAGPTDRISDAKLARQRAKQLEKRKRLGSYKHIVSSNTLSHSCRSGVDQLVSYAMSAVCCAPWLLAQRVSSAGKRTRRCDGVAAP